MAKPRLIDRIKRWFTKDEPEESQTSVAAPVEDRPMSYKSPDTVYPIPDRLRSR